MKLIHRGRGEGKTHDLIIECANDHIGLLVVSNHTMVRYTQRIAASMGLTIREPITFQQLIDGTVLRVRSVRLYIDNVDMLLQMLAGTRAVVDTITLNRNFHLHFDDDNTSKD